MISLRFIPAIQCVWGIRTIRSPVIVMCPRYQLAFSYRISGTGLEGGFQLLTAFAVDTTRLTCVCYLSSFWRWRVLYCCAATMQVNNENSAIAC
jgi:hypothetical protein